MRQILTAIIVTTVLTLAQITLFSMYPFALVSFCAWIWWKDARYVIPWASVSIILIDLYSNTFGVGIIQWAIVMGLVSLICSTILTNRSLFALLAVMLTGYILGSMIYWVLWYIVSFFVSNIHTPYLWYDIHLMRLALSLLGTGVYAIILWFLFSRGKRGRRVFIVSDQVL